MGRLTTQTTTDIKKLLYFFGMCAYGVGSIGGFGYALYCKAWVIAACVAVLAAMAFPKAKEFYNKLTE